jgi:hypothetical protein
MLTSEQRMTRYFAQSGRKDLTPRQRRRIQHKRFHQSGGALVRRHQRAQVRATQAAKRAELKRFRLGVDAAAAS